MGRKHELELLRTKLLDALAGRGGVILLGGEPGIGKTRLAEELAFDAAQHGMLVLWGRCWESEGAPPFWPWIELLRGLVRCRERSTLRRDLGSGASLIAGLVPEIREGLPDLPSGATTRSAEARFRLFDAVTTLFRNVCSSSPRAAGAGGPALGRQAVASAAGVPVAVRRRSTPTAGRNVPRHGAA